MQALRNPNDPRQIQEVVNNVVKQFDNYGFVALRVSQTTTVIINGKINSGSLVVIQPIGSLAAAAYALGTTYVSAVGDGQFTITHPSATTERKFGYVIHGV